MKSDPVDWFVKGIFFLVLGPPLLCIFLQLVGAVLVQVLPFLILLAVVVGLTAGISRALMGGRRSSTRPWGAPYGPPFRNPFSRREEKW